MTSDLDEIKRILDKWLTSQLKQTFNIREGKDEIIHINSSVLQLENWLLDWRKSHELNERLDASIMSERILKNPDSDQHDKAFKPYDYQLNFLHFLAVNYDTSKDLFMLIDDFVDQYKGQFSFVDIVITKTGVTRCKTNIRFGLDKLRDLGFVLSRDINDRRSWSPSITGLIALININYQIEVLGNTALIFKDFHELRSLKKQQQYLAYPFDPTLYHSLDLFSHPAYLYQFLDWLAYETNDKFNQLTIKSIIDRYIKFTQEALEITNKGVKFTKRFDELSKLFQKDLFDYQFANLPFMQVLLDYFQSKQRLH